MAPGVAARIARPPCKASSAAPGRSGLAAGFGCTRCGGRRQAASCRLPRPVPGDRHARGVKACYDRPDGCAGAAGGDRHANTFCAFRLLARSGAVCRDAVRENHTGCQTRSFATPSPECRESGVVESGRAIASRGRVGAKSPDRMPLTDERAGSGGAARLQWVRSPRSCASIRRRLSSWSRSVVMDMTCAGERTRQLRLHREPAEALNGVCWRRASVAGAGRDAAAAPASAEPIR